MTSEEYLKHAEERYWNDVDFFIDRWIVNPRPIEEIGNIQIATRKNHIDFARALDKQEEDNASSNTVPDIKPQAKLLIRTRAVRDAVMGYFNRAMRRKYRMLDLISKSIQSDNADLYLRCHLQLAKTGSLFFFNLPAPLTKKQFLSVYLEQLEEGQKDSIAGLTDLVHNLDNSDADWVLLNDLIFEQEWFLVVMNASVLNDVERTGTTSTAIIGMVAGKTPAVYQHCLIRGLVPDRMPSLPG